MSETDDDLVRAFLEEGGAVEQCEPGEKGGGQVAGDSLLVRARRATSANLAFIRRWRLEGEMRVKFANSEWHVARVHDKGTVTLWKVVDGEPSNKKEHVITGTNANSITHIQQGGEWVVTDSPNNRGV